MSSSLFIRISKIISMSHPNIHTFFHDMYWEINQKFKLKLEAR